MCFSWMNSSFSSYSFLTGLCEVLMSSFSLTCSRQQSERPQFGESGRIYNRRVKWPTAQTREAEEDVFHHRKNSNFNNDLEAKASAKLGFFFSNVTFMFFTYEDVTDKVNLMQNWCSAKGNKINHMLEQMQRFWCPFSDQRLVLACVTGILHADSNLTRLLLYLRH